MSDKELSPRQRKILLYCQIGKSYALSEIADLLYANGSPSISAPTLRRDLAVLCELGFLEKTGNRKFSRYSLNSKSLIFTPIDAHQYCSLDIDERPGSAQFNFKIFDSIPESLFSPNELLQLNKGTEQYLHSSHGASPAVFKKELERFVIELSWKSSKIEGNTYTLLDTELLLREGIEAVGHTREETLMIINHKKAFDYILEIGANFMPPRLSQIIDIHRLLVTDLNIEYGLRRRLIGITGSVYRPLAVPTQIEEACAELITTLHRLQNPYSQALTTLIGISYIQPFEDGNKRTARLGANAILLASNCAPLSYRSVNEVAYREAVLTFYEKNTILPLKEIFIEQYLFACENYMQFIPH